MYIKSISIQLIKKIILFILIITFLIFIVYFTMSHYFIKSNTETQTDELTYFQNNIKEQNVSSNDESSEYIEDTEEESASNNKYIKWVDFDGTATCLTKLAKLDITSHLNNEEIKFNWIELMSYLACKYGGDFSKFKQTDLDNLVSELKSGKTIEELSNNYKTYNYYYKSYDAIFHEYIGNYTIQSLDDSGNKTYNTTYGIKVFSPIASGYNFSHYKDFGTSRSYGYKRVHLGNDLLRKYWYSYNSS